MGLKTNKGGVAPQMAQPMAFCGALTPQEAAKAIIRDGQAYLAKPVHDAVSKETVKDRFAAWAKIELQKMGEGDDFVRHLRIAAHGDNMTAFESLLRAAKRSDVIRDTLLPDGAESHAKWLRNPQTPFAIKFKAAWCALMAAEGKVVPAYYPWYLNAKCPRNAKAALAEWLAALAPQQAQHAA